MADETSTPTPTTETVAPTEQQTTPSTEAPSTTSAETAPTEKKQEEIDFSRFNAALKDGEKKELLPDDEENSVKEVLKPAKFNLDEQREFTIAPGNMMPASKLVYPHILNFDVLHAKAEVVLLCKKPKIYAFEFLKDEEAEELKALATPERLLPGKVGYGTNGGAVVRNFRHALDACIPVNAVPEWFYKRVEDLIGFPRTHFENVHICKYTEGGHFTPHVDYSQTNDWEGLKPFGGQRVATFLCYLNALQPGQGGETEFPFAGIKMRPVKDVCLYTFNFTSDGRADPLTFHAALPVVGAETEKWIALLGIREHAYDDKTFDDVVPAAEGAATATETADPATEVSTPKQEEAPKAEEPKVEA